MSICFNHWQLGSLLLLEKNMPVRAVMWLRANYFTVSIFSFENEDCGNIFLIGLWQRLNEMLCIYTYSIYVYNILYTHICIIYYYTCMYNICVFYTYYTYIGRIKYILYKGKLIFLLLFSWWAFNKSWLSEWMSGVEGQTQRVWLESSSSNRTTQLFHLRKREKGDRWKEGWKRGG